MATASVSRRFEVLQDRELSAVDLAAFQLASRPLAKRRQEIGTGTQPVYVKCLITGGLEIGQPVATKTPADTLGVLAYVLARLPANQRAAVQAAVAAPGFQVSKADREAARLVAAGTQRDTQRAGALTGAVDVALIR